MSNSTHSETDLGMHRYESMLGNIMISTTASRESAAKKFDSPSRIPWAPYDPRYDLALSEFRATGFMGNDRPRSGPSAALRVDDEDEMEPVKAICGYA